MIWTQSAVKDLENPITCPWRWNEMWVKKSFKKTPSLQQLYGNYFEYLAIGANATPGEIPELPKTLKNEKTSVQKRIELQAQVYKDLVDPLSKNYIGYKVVNVQVPLKGKINGIDVEGTADIVAVDSKGNPVIIDLKCTEDCFSVHSQYAWGNKISELDLIQQVLYQELYYQMHNKKPHMVLMVFDYGPKMRSRVINLTISESRIYEVSERIKQADDVYKLYETHGWIKCPSERECSSCPLSCDERIGESKTFVEFHNY